MHHEASMTGSVSEVMRIRENTERTLVLLARMRKSETEVGTVVRASLLRMVTYVAARGSLRAILYQSKITARRMTFRVRRGIGVPLAHRADPLACGTRKTCPNAIFLG